MCRRVPGLDYLMKAGPMLEEIRVVCWLVAWYPVFDLQWVSWSWYPFYSAPGETF